MAYITLGSRRAVGKLDTTQNNTGNWTVSFTPDVHSVTMAQFEVYKIVISSKTTQFIVNFTVFVENNQWDASFIPGGNLVTSNTWDPSKALIMRDGESLFFYFQEVASDGTPPTVTIWLQYDNSIRENQIHMHGGA